MTDIRAWSPQVGEIQSLHRHRFAEQALYALAIPGDPIPKGRPRRGRNGVWYAPVKTERARDRLRDGLRASGAQLQHGPLALSVDLARSTHRRADVDNLLALVMDACRGYVWRRHDDVAEVVATRRVDRDDPRTTLAVSPSTATFRGHDLPRIASVHELMHRAEALWTASIPGNPTPKLPPESGSKIHTPAATHDAERRLAFLMQDAPVFDGPVALSVEFHRSEGPMVGDLADLLKLVMDAGNRLQGGLWADDCQVERLYVAQRVGAAQPRTVLAVGPAEQF